MKSIKPIVVVTIVVAIITIMIPALLVLPFSQSDSEGTLTDKSLSVKKKGLDLSRLDKSSVEVAVYRSANKQVDKLPLEKYIAGVVAAEMPADFELEALKAQALTARTFIIDQMLRGNSAKSLDGADVSDTVQHQVYKNNEELKQAWGTDYDWKYKKIAQAVLATEGQILTYEGKPITATFFSTSNGYTENSEDLWPNAYPYLKSVASPWDKKSPKFYDRKVIPIAQFEQKLGVKINNAKDIGFVVERTPGKRVATVDINGKKVSGITIREALDLRSTDFNWERKGDNIIISTRGYGHGVGMSQYGANGMAKEGKNYQQIVKHYYQGIEIASTDTLAEKIVAQK